MWACSGGESKSGNKDISLPFCRDHQLRVNEKFPTPIISPIFLVRRWQLPNNMLRNGWNCSLGLDQPTTKAQKQIFQLRPVHSRMVLPQMTKTNFCARYSRTFSRIEPGLRTSFFIAAFAARANNNRRHSSSPSTGVMQAGSKAGPEQLS